ncbi:DUF5336 domain-containing protein [Parasphingorhabdus pacifica]
MSAPYGMPQQAPQQPTPQGASSRKLALPSILVLVAAGAGLLGYLLAFFGPAASAIFSGLPGLCLVAAATLAGMRFLPKAPNMLYAAAPLAVYAPLGLLQVVVNGGGSGLVVVLLLLAIVQLGAVAAVLLDESGLITLPAGKASLPKPGAGRPGPSGQPGQPGGPAGQPGQPGQFGQKPVPAPPQPPWAQPGPHTGPQPHVPQPGQHPHAPAPQQGGWVPSAGGAVPSSPHGQPAPQAAPHGQPGGQQQGQGSPGGQQPEGQPQGGGQQQGGQQGGGQQQGGQASSGPQGTQQMPHPGA